VFERGGYCVWKLNYYLFVCFGILFLKLSFVSLLDLVMLHV